MHTLCEGNHIDLRMGQSRREFLYAGFAGGLGLTLPQMLKLQAELAIPEVPKVAAKADSIIHIYLPGGIAHRSEHPRREMRPQDQQLTLERVDPLLLVVGQARLP